MRAYFVLLFIVSFAAAAAAQGGRPEPALVDTPTVKALTGLTVPQFEAEMQQFVQGLGGSCGTCHVRGNFASDDNPRKLTARRMIEMTKALNAQFFPDYKPAEGESTLGRVTCYTCHQGSDKPKTAVGPADEAGHR